jgi:hypothetical protein
MVSKSCSRCRMLLRVRLQGGNTVLTIPANDQPFRVKLLSASSTHCHTSVPSASRNAISTTKVPRARIVPITQHPTGNLEPTQSTLIRFLPAHFIATTANDTMFHRSGYRLVPLWFRGGVFVAFAPVVARTGQPDCFYRSNLLPHRSAKDALRYIFHPMKLNRARINFVRGVVYADFPSTSLTSSTLLQSWPPQLIGHIHRIRSYHMHSPL